MYIYALITCSGSNYFIRKSPTRYDPDDPDGCTETTACRGSMLSLAFSLLPLATVHDQQQQNCSYQHHLDYTGPEGAIVRGPQNQFQVSSLNMPLDGTNPPPKTDCSVPIYSLVHLYYIGTGSVLLTNIGQIHYRLK